MVFGHFWHSSPWHDRAPTHHRENVFPSPPVTGSYLPKFVVGEQASFSLTPPCFPLFMAWCSSSPYLKFFLPSLPSFWHIEKHTSHGHRMWRRRKLCSLMILYITPPHSLPPSQKPLLCAVAGEGERGGEYKEDCQCLSHWPTFHTARIIFKFD